MNTTDVIASALIPGNTFVDGKVVTRIVDGGRDVRVFVRAPDGAESAFFVGADDEVTIRTA